MEQTQVTRRDFLQTVSMAGIAALAAGGMAGSVMSENAAVSKKGIFICEVCGHIEFNSAPEACPICHAGKEKFERNDTVFSDAELKFKTATDKHVPVVTARKKSTLVTEAASIAVTAKIGSTIHPMEEAHYIRFIDCYIDDVYVSRLSLTLRNHPTVGIDIKAPGNKVRVVVLCNLHSYWQAESTVM